MTDGLDRRLGAAWGALAALVLVGFVLRVATIGSVPLWFDEAITLSIAQWPLGDLFLRPVDQSPGLYYALVKLFGLTSDPVSARSLALVFGTLTIPATYALARGGLGRTASLVAAGVVALSAYLIDYSQEGRPYSLVVLLLTLIGVGLTRWTATRRTGWLALALIGAVLASYTHFIGLLGAGLLLAAVLPTADRFERRDKWRYRLGLMLVLIGIVPELLRSLKRAGEVGAMGWLLPDTLPSFLGRWSEVTLPTALVAPAWSNAGIAGAALLLVVVVGSLAIILRNSTGRTWVRSNPAFAVVVGVLLLFPIVLWAFSLAVTPVLMPRTALPGCVGMALLLGIAVERSGKAWAGVLVLAAFAAALVVSGTIRPRDRWDQVANFLDRNAGSDDLVVACPDWQAGALVHQWAGNGRPVVLAYRDTLRLLLPWRRGHAAQDYFTSVLEPALAGIKGRVVTDRTVMLSGPRRVWVVAAGCDSPPLEQWLGTGERNVVLRLPKGSDSRAIEIWRVVPANDRLAVTESLLR